MRTDTQEEGKASSDVLPAVYSEICKSYQAIDDFRTKLLGLLPFTSLAGIALLSKNAGLPTASKGPNEPLAFAAVFASAFTLTLFVYEIRGILRCDGLIQRGKDIEKRRHVDGQFHQCAAEMNALSTKFLILRLLPVWCTHSYLPPGFSLRSGIDMAYRFWRCRFGSRAGYPNGRYGILPRPAEGSSISGLSRSVERIAKLIWDKTPISQFVLWVRDNRHRHEIRSLQAFLIKIR
jgi:hypothetical protein